MASIGVSRRKGFWSWPGPVRSYEAVLVMAAFLPVVYFRQTGFTMSATAAVLICATFLSAILRKDLTAKEWGNLNRYTIWVVRAAAASVGGWMFIDAPARTAGYAAVSLFAALYTGCEIAVWRRKRAVLSANLNS